MKDKENDTNDTFVYGGREWKEGEYPIFKKHCRMYGYMSNYLDGFYLAKLNYEATKSKVN